MAGLKKITVVMAGDEEGGLEKHVVELSNGLAARGYAVTLIAHAKYQSRLSQDVHFVAVDLSKSRRNLLLLWRLYQAIKISQPDVLHVQASKAVAMVAPLLKWLNVPSVATVHGIKKNLNAYLQFDLIIAVSQRVASRFATRQKVRVVWNGLNPPQQIDKPRPKQADIQAIAIGRLVSVKGFDVLIAAWQGIDAKLWIVGDGPEQQALSQHIQALGLQHHIELLGYRADIAMLLAQSDVLIISSRQEGGPYTLAEALLTKTPVLATDVGMVAEVLPPELICEPDNIAALHTLLQKHLSDLDKLNQISHPIYPFAQDHLSFAAMLDNTITVYQELVSGDQNTMISPLP